jgi:hypothetical protein
VDRNGRAITLIGAQVSGGLSGSPVLDDRGRVIGVVSCGSATDGIKDSEEGGQPIPLTNLPAWLLADLRPSPLTNLPKQMTALQTAWEVRQRRSFREAKARAARAKALTGSNGSAVRV